MRLSHRHRRFLLATSTLLTVAVSCGGQPGDPASIGSFDEALCPKVANPPEGIDVSEFQGTINWAAVKASGRSFAIARVSDGTGHPDPTFKTNWAGIKGLVELYQATVGIVGMGDIGVEIAKRCRVFGMNIVYHQRTRLDHTTEATLNLSYASLDDLLATADSKRG